MANDDPNDVNKSKSQSVNGDFIRRSLEESRERPSYLIKMQQNLDVRTAELARIRESISEGHREGAPAADLNELREKNIAATISRELLYERTTSAEQNSLERRSKTFAGGLMRGFSESHISGRIAELGRSPEVVNSSTSLRGLSSQELYSQHQAAMSEIGGIGEQVRKIAPNLVGEEDPKKREEGLAQLNELHKKKEEVLKRAAAQSVAMRMQRHLGEDEESQMERLYKSGKIATSILSQDAMTRQIAEKDSVTIEEKIDKNTGKSVGGREIKMAEVNAEIIKQSEKLAKALENLATTTDETKKKEETEKAKEAQKSLDTLREGQKIKASMSDGEMISQKTRNLMLGSSIAGAIGGGAQEILVNSRMRTMSNQAGFANWENQKYDAYRAALSGDMQSLAMLKQFSNAENFGDQIKTGGQVAGGLRAVGGALEAAAGYGFATAGSAGTVLGGTAAIQGTQMIVNGTVTAITSGLDVGKSLIGPGGEPNTQKLAAQQEYMNAARAVSYVSTFQQQQLYNFSAGMGRAAIGMGGKGEAFLNATLGDKAFLNKMQGLNISPDEMAKMANFGVNNIGSTFNENMALTARGLEKSGMGTREENLQRMSILAQAGANNPQSGLASVLEAAVGKGFDNSKSMTMLVQNTGEMAKQSAVSIAAGADVTGSIATILASGADRNMPNREFALERSRTVQQSLNEAATNTSTDLMGLINTSNISAQTGLGAISAQAAAKLTPADLLTLKGMKTDKEREDFFIKLGIDPSEFKEGIGKGINALQRTQMQAMVSGRGGEGLGKSTEEVRSSIMNSVKERTKYEDLTKEQKLLLGRLREGVGGEEMYEGLMATRATNEKGAKGTVNKLIKGEIPESDALRKAADEILTASSGQLSDAAKEATKSIGSAATALKGFSKIFQDMRADKSLEKKFAEAAGRAAGEGESQKQVNEVFEGSVSKFGKHIDRLEQILNAANLSGRTSTAIPAPTHNKSPTKKVKPK